MDTRTEPVIGDDDPYGDCIRAIIDIIHIALEREGAMSNGEHANLTAIEEFIRTRDNS